MGFRTSLISEDAYISWPDKFKKKYRHLLYMPSGGCLSTKMPMKTYNYKEMFEDIQKAIPWKKSKREKFNIILLAECGGVQRVWIKPKEILYDVPTRFEFRDGLEHGYYCKEIDCNGLRFTLHQVVEKPKKHVMTEPEKRLFKYMTKKWKKKLV